MNDRSGDKMRTNTAKFTNMIIARFTDSRYLVRVSKVFVKDTRSSATAKSTARPSCLVGVLYDISREEIC